MGAFSHDLSPAHCCFCDHEVRDRGIRTRIARIKAHPGGNFLALETIITGDAFIGGVVSSVPPVISTMHKSPADGVCDNEGVC